MAERKIEYVPLDSLKADPRNPKSHDLSTIDASYSRFGVVDVVTVDGRTGYIASGHGRTTALRDAFARGEEVPEGVKVDEATGQWLVPVNTGWSSKNDVEAAAALIAMNRVTEMGGWVDENLLELLSEIGESGTGFDGIGFSEVDMDDLRHLLEDAPDLDALADEWNPDDVPGSGSGSSVTVKLTDPAVVDAWHTARDAAKNDDEAMRVLMGMSPAPAPVKAKKKGRGSEPTVEDLAPVDATVAGLNAADALMAGLAPVSTPMETPVDNSDGLDWATAGMGEPEGYVIADETDAVEYAIRGGEDDEDLPEEGDSRVDIGTVTVDVDVTGDDGSSIGTVGVDVPVYADVSGLSLEEAVANAPATAPASDAHVIGAMHGDAEFTVDLADAPETDDPA